MKIARRGQWAKLWSNYNKGLSRRTFALIGEWRPRDHKPGVLEWPKEEMISRR